MLKVMNLTLIRQSPMSNSSELFSHATICSSFELIDPLFFGLPCTQTDTHTHTYTASLKKRPLKVAVRFDLN